MQPTKVEFTGNAIDDIDLALSTWITKKIHSKIEYGYKSLRNMNFAPHGFYKDEEGKTVVMIGDTPVLSADPDADPFLLEE